MTHTFKTKYFTEYDSESDMYCVVTKKGIPISFFKTLEEAEESAYLESCIQELREMKTK